MNERIKQVRQSAGLTQLQFAERLGLSRNFIAMSLTSTRTGFALVTERCRVSLHAAKKLPNLWAIL